jgi:hypothetical protein
LLSLNKTYYFITLLISFGFYASKSQNLIRNSSFENFINQHNPSVEGAFDNYNVTPFVHVLNDWNTFNSSDHYDSAFAVGGYNVPYSVIGNSYAKNGYAFVGLIAFVKAGETKEYINQHLSIPLKGDTNYCLSFFVSRADRVTYSIKNMGACFSINSPTLVSNYYINATPQIVSSGYISDTVNWVEVKGCFTAQGGEEYLTIGNFNSNANTDTLFVGSTNPHPGANGYAYYYIDSVILYQNNFPTAVKELSLNGGVKVYPNPTEGSLTISIPKGEGIEPKQCVVKIIDVLGREALVCDYKEQLNISQLEKGIYFLSLYEDKKLLGTKKIIKQ